MRIVISLFTFFAISFSQDEFLKNIPSINDIKSLKNPFQMHSNLPQNITKEQSEYSVKNFNLEAIMPKSAKINGKWIKIGDIIAGYKLITIGKNFVRLQSLQKKIDVKFTKGSRVKFQ